MIKDIKEIINDNLITVFAETEKNIGKRIVGSAEITNITNSIKKFKNIIPSVEFSSEDIWMFNRVFVLEEFRSNKIATRMMERLKSIAKEKKINVLCDAYSYFGKLDKKTMDFYEKFGFEIAFKDEVNCVMILRCEN